MQLLVIDSSSKQKIGDLKVFSESNEFSLNEMLDVVANPEKAAGNFEQYKCYLDFGYKVVYTIEQHPNEKFRHMSISLNDKLPPVESVELIMEEFGFKNKLSDCMTYAEGDIAINILEIY